MKKVLIVEDDEFLQSLESTKLKKEGYEVFVAGTGEEALIKVEEANFDLLLLDLILPNFDGFEILKKVREYEKTKDINKSKELGANFFMVKSNFTLDELVEHVNKIFNR
jgi:DNA-binding response OmpR family regulator